MGSPRVPMTTDLPPESALSVPSPSSSSSSSSSHHANPQVCTYVVSNILPQYFEDFKRKFLLASYICFFSLNLHVTVHCSGTYFKKYVLIVGRLVVSSDGYIYRYFLLCSTGDERESKVGEDDSRVQPQDDAS